MAQKAKIPFWFNLYFAVTLQYLGGIGFCYHF